VEGVKGYCYKKEVEDSSSDRRGKEFILYWRG